MPLVNKQIKVEDFYKTSLTSSITTESGDINFTVGTAPQNTKGFIIISPNDNSKRELVYYHNVIGNTIYVYGVNRQNGKTHEIDEIVQINDTANLFNFISVNLDTCFYCEKISALQVNVWGGPIIIGNTEVSVDDTIINLSNNTINYIYISKNDYTIKSATSTPSVLADNGIIVAQINCSFGSISSIEYRKHRIVEGIPGEKGDKGDKGDTGDIGNPTSNGQTISDIATQSGVTVTTDGTTYIRVTLENGFYTQYELARVITANSADEISSEETASGTFGTNGITYEDGTFINKITGYVSFTGSPAYRNKANTFLENNNFNKDSVFLGNVSFPYYRIDMTGTDIIDFNASNGTKQRTINLTTGGTKTLNFENLFAGANYELAINNNSGGNIILTKGVISNSNGVTKFYSIGGTAYPLTLSAGVHLFVMETFDTAIHISYLGQSVEF